MRREPHQYPQGELVVVIDCAQLDRSAEFWTGVLGYLRDGVATGRYQSLLPAHGPGAEILLQQVPEDKQGKNRVHLDLRTRDLEPEMHRLVSLGARLLTEQPVTESGWRWHILADPDGNEFCVLEPPASYWPAGSAWINTAGMRTPGGRDVPRDPWPPARVRLGTPRLELRLPDEDELAQLAAVAGDGVHEAGAQPFGVAWGAQPPRLRARSVQQWHWATRGTWSPDRWTFDFAVFLGGEPVGAQGLTAAGFPVRREVATGSWLGRRYQGQGFGQEMRAAVLALAFGYLHARSAVTGAYYDNAAAIGVSKALGYASDGEEIADREGARVVAHRFRLAATSGMGGWPAVTIEGVDDEVLGMCGAQDPAGERALPLGGYPHA